ncbi:hypothetical protein OJ252_1332 [Cryptosporidium canis]|uniref:Uncharacterized protein n=1 Tax=Cryptosporidium canis TaxID=195482 RepID=A0ABQ8P9F8_9CRYT|nr:hypothetical protein OJ252_1332 [Cryptosporidium canis]
MSNHPRLTCKGLLRESLSSMNGVPSLTTICVNKLRTIRNSITSLKERGISKDLIYLIFKGSTCHELLAAERNNVGIEKMFGSDDGKIWDSLWETAVKIRFSHSEQTLSKKESSETYREFFIRSQEDAERKFKSHILKRSNSMGGSKVKRSVNVEPSLIDRRTLSLSDCSSSENSNPLKRSINVLESTPVFNSQSTQLRPKNFKTTTTAKRPSKLSNNPILREYFELKSKENCLNRLGSSANSRIRGI